MSITEKRAKTRMDREINYSIIIPHKNIPELLLRCIDSIPRRKDVQIIVIDDNSDNDKVDFEHFPCLDDPFVEVVFTKEGKGAGYARNVGLTKAVGKWFLFADADDYFTEGFLQYLDKYNESSYDLIYFGIYGIDTETKKENHRGRKYNKLMKDAVYKQKYDAYKYTAYVPWGKIIKKSLIMENNISFDETMVANDMIFSLKTAYHAKNIFFDENKIYTLESRRDSLMNVRSKEANLCRFSVYLRVNDFLDNIAKKKYKLNYFLLLLKLFDIQNMTYFQKGMSLIKENKINLFNEFIIFSLSLPYRIIRKIKNIILDKVYA
jgi:glycosyltransferase involved in cell wall biosynthesis